MTIGTYIAVGDSISRGHGIASPEPWFVLEIEPNLAGATAIARNRAVFAGVAVNGVPGTADVPLPVGSYWFQKGGERHVTKCISPNECIFFISQNEKFDYVTDAAGQ